ncbi:hypothetical protein HS088_TW09G00906 [Tripterygium wilfordii]|uniref:Uncharacterized protein n=1 Tax=Tripterygium wilfordii TaxID=458696 RepID=A0A7J7D8Z6_TRIWF|nr:hypothetical protein HS088_TW09G00906 [Tripterygium wilfordii]
MGNCIEVQFNSKKEKAKVFIFNGGEKEFKASTPLKKITSGAYHGYKLVRHSQSYAPLLPTAKLEPGQVYHLVPMPLVLVHPSRLLLSSKLANKRQFVKIILTRQQLELLLRNAMDLKGKRVSLGFAGSSREGNQKWKPSLAPITEL